jgi:hypothetical protein
VELILSSFSVGDIYMAKQALDQENVGVRPILLNKLYSINDKERILLINLVKFLGRCLKILFVQVVHKIGYLCFHKPHLQVAHERRTPSSKELQNMCAK